MHVDHLLNADMSGPIWAHSYSDKNNKPFNDMLGSDEKASAGRLVN